MKKKNLIISLIFVTISFFVLYSINFRTNTLEAIVLNIEDNLLTVRDKNNINYVFEIDNVNVKKCADIIIEYVGRLNKDKEIQDNKVVNYSVPDILVTSEGIPIEYLDNGIFSEYYKQAINKLNSLSLDEKIEML